ncbi:MAG TPA: flagellar export chaperone FlgN [Solirubrobacteraceae bacterium]|jgi:hypothetical protein|nr:flagellar export chaperone FlgN [Solirubrobacteraceae bacterium]
MSAAVVPAVPGLGQAVLDHLDRQTASARRLLELILRQGAAIREHRAEDVVASLIEIQREMTARAELEAERERVLRLAGRALGADTPDVTLTRLCTILDEEDARAAQESSAELRGLLAEIGGQHALNRALMRQELAFLDHLIRLAGGDHGPVYDRDAVPSGPAQRPGMTPHQLDARA